MMQETKLLSLLTKFKELGIDKQIDYDKFYLYSIITHSTAIEGSTVTAVENQLLFDEGISAAGRSIDEQLMNLDLKSAYERSFVFAKNNVDITSDMLRELSAYVMKNTGTQYNTPLGKFSSSDGDFRLFNVTAGVGGHSYLNFAKVPMKLEELCHDLNKRRKLLTKSDIIECYRLSFDAHFQLVTIHPWADGNGRMSRLLMNQIQVEFGVVPSNIDKNHKAKYIEALIATRENNNIEIFYNFMFDEHIQNLENTINNFQNSSLFENVRVNVRVNVLDKLTLREQDIVEIIGSNSRITVAQLAKQLGVNERTIRRDIANLKQQNRLVRIGSDKNGEWKLK